MYLLPGWLVGFYGVSMSRISFVCTWLISFNSSYFFVQPCFSQEKTFSNNSVKLVNLKNRFLMTAKALHPIRICLTVQVVWQVKHCDCGSRFSMKEWVTLVWPMRNRDIMTCSLLDFLKAVPHSTKLGWIWKSLLWMLISHVCCHFVWRNLLIVGFKSEYGILISYLIVFLRL